MSAWRLVQFNDCFLKMNVFVSFENRVIMRQFTLKDIWRYIYWSTVLKYKFEVLLLPILCSFIFLLHCISGVIIIHFTPLQLSDSFSYCFTNDIHLILFLSSENHVSPNLVFGSFLLWVEKWNMMHCCRLNYTTVHKVVQICWTWPTTAVKYNIQ